jgi:hypothetical protein
MLNRTCDKQHDKAELMCSIYLLLYISVNTDSKINSNSNSYSIICLCKVCIKMFTDSITNTGSLCQECINIKQQKLM